jgi:hypothetical protein
MFSCQAASGPDHHQNLRPALRLLATILGPGSSKQFVSESWVLIVGSYLYQKLVVAPIPQYRDRAAAALETNVFFLLETQQRYKIKDSGSFICCTWPRPVGQRFTFSVQDILLDKQTNSGQHRTKHAHATRASHRHILCSRCCCYWDCKPTGEALDGTTRHRCL